MKKQQAKHARKEFRESVLKHDGYRCAMCDSDKELSAHHIINKKHIPYGGYVLKNGITLCGECHIKAEDTYFGREYHEDYTPDVLFKYRGHGDVWWQVLSECIEKENIL